MLYFSDQAVRDRMWRVDKSRALLFSVSDVYKNEAFQSGLHEDSLMLLDLCSADLC